MSFMLLSDIHGSPGALDKAFNLADNANAERIIILGDLLNHGPRNPLPHDYEPAAVAEMLNSRSRQITCVRGNCDSEVDQMLIRSPILADYVLMLTDRRQLFLTHGHLWSPEKLPELSEGDLFCYGHTHIPVAEKNSEGVVLFNPGSVTLPKGGHKPSVGWYSSDMVWVTDMEGQEIMSYHF